jgi:hypothetical protein
MVNLKDIINFQIGMYEHYKINVFLPNISSSYYKELSKITETFYDEIMRPALKQVSDDHFMSHIPLSYSQCIRCNCNKFSQYKFPTYYIPDEYINNLVKKLIYISNSRNDRNFKNIFFLIQCQDLKLVHYNYIENMNHQQSLLSQFIQNNDYISNAFIMENFNNIIFDFGIEYVPNENEPITLLWHGENLKNYFETRGMKPYSLYTMLLLNNVKGITIKLNKKDVNNFNLLMINCYNLEKEYIYSKSKSKGLTNFSQRDFWKYYGKYRSSFTTLISTYNNLINLIME